MGKDACDMFPIVCVCTCECVHVHTSAHRSALHLNYCRMDLKISTKAGKLKYQEAKQTDKQGQALGFMAALTV